MRVSLDRQGLKLSSRLGSTKGVPSLAGKVVGKERVVVGRTRLKGRLCECDNKCPVSTIDAEAEGREGLSTEIWRYGGKEKEWAEWEPRDGNEEKKIRGAGGLERAGNGMGDGMAEVPRCEY